MRIIRIAHSVFTRALLMLRKEPLRFWISERLKDRKRLMMHGLRLQVESLRRLLPSLSLEGLLLSTLPTLGVFLQQGWLYDIPRAKRTMFRCSRINVIIQIVYIANNIVGYLRVETSFLPSPSYLSTPIPGHYFSECLYQSFSISV